MKRFIGCKNLANRRRSHLGQPGMHQLQGVSTFQTEGIHTAIFSFPTSSMGVPTFQSEGIHTPKQDTYVNDHGVSTLQIEGIHTMKTLILFLSFVPKHIT